MLIRKSTLPLMHLLLVGWMPSPLKKAFYRGRGYKIGANARLGLGSVIVGDDVEIGAEVQIGMLTVMRGRRIKVGPRARIGMMTVIDCPVIDVGEGTRINNQVVVGGLTTPQSAFKIGRNCILMEWSFVNTTLPVTIGDDVGIGGHCLFFTHGMWPNTFEGFPAKYAPIVIHDQAWLAWRVSVLPGVTIGKRTIISSDACVVKDVPDGALAAGVPAKVLQENERFIGQHDVERNAERLRVLMVEFRDWLVFNGVGATWNGTDQLDIDHAKQGAGTIRLRTSEGQVERQDSRTKCVISVPALSAADRERLEAQGVAWLDVTSKVRSRLSNAIVDEAETFLQRGGLRFLKYSAW